MTNISIFPFIADLINYLNTEYLGITSWYVADAQTCFSIVVDDAVAFAVLDEGGITFIKINLAGDITVKYTYDDDDDDNSTLIKTTNINSLTWTDVADDIGTAIYTKNTDPVSSKPMTTINFPDINIEFTISFDKLVIVTPNNTHYFKNNPFSYEIMPPLL